MADVSVASVITGFVSGILSSVVTYFSTRSKIRLDLAVEYDKDLRQKRLELYRELWPKTKPLAEFSAEAPITFEVIKAVSGEMRDWYFAEGGIYLSKRSRRPYFNLKSLMQEILDDNSLQQDHAKPIHGTQLKKILVAARELRTSLSDDIRARNEPWL
jgi:hypothetical protein